MARALIVGCGCRGAAAGRAAACRGLGGARDDAGARRGWRRSRRAGSSRRSPTPIGPAPLLDLVGDVTVVCWLLGSAQGEPEEIAAIHGPRLERMLEKLVDTPVRGFVYEAAGSVRRHHLERGEGTGARGRAAPGGSRSRWSSPIRDGGMRTSAAVARRMLAATALTHEPDRAASRIMC